MKAKKLWLFAITVLALGLITAGCGEDHSHVWVPASCTTPKTCEICQETQGSPLGHAEETVAGKPATCTEDGLTEGKYCSICEQVLAEQTVIPALGHDYGSEIHYVWSDDNSTCTAGRLCKNDETHTIGETATVHTVTLDVREEKVTYCYSVAFESSEYAPQTKTVESPASAVNGVVTVNAPVIADRAASHDYVKFGFHGLEETYSFTISYSQIDVWDGVSVSTGLSGSGTAEDPYLIQSGADLAYLKSVIDATAGGAGENYKVHNFAGQYFKMTKSIDLNGRNFMIGYHKSWNDYACFAGIFDGNHCSIRGLNMATQDGSVGLFACVQAGAAIQNFTLYGNATGSGKIGSAVAYLLGTADNITSYVTVTATGGTVGGIVANAESGESIVSNCVNYGNVTSSSYIIGGIAGSGGNSFINCTNFGNVTAGSECVGGITGTTKEGGTISGCANYGAVTTTAADKGHVGGIAGKCLKPVSGCANYGAVSGVNTVGGICGSTTQAVTDCENRGTVNGTSWLIGGIAGSAKGEMTNCTNRGDVTSTGDCVGGVVGSARAKVSNCYNYGTVTGVGRSGGIAYHSTAAIEGCINYGDVTGGWDLGGILAWVGEGQSATVTNCTNNGNITGTNNNGGIFGLAHKNAGTVTITDCTNNGQITATTGGQISIASKAVITQCTENGSFAEAKE